MNRKWKEDGKLLRCGSNKSRACVAEARDALMLEAQPPCSVRKFVVGYYLGKQEAQGVQCVFQSELFVQVGGFAEPRGYRTFSGIYFSGQIVGAPFYECIK